MNQYNAVTILTTQKLKLIQFIKAFQNVHFSENDRSLQQRDYIQESHLQDEVLLPATITRSTTVGHSVGITS